MLSARSAETIVFLTLSLLLNHITCANILGVFPSPLYSQYILAESLMVALAEKGHNVTVLSGFETKGIKNLNNIKIDLLMKTTEDDALLYKIQDMSLFVNQMLLSEFGLTCTEKILNDSRTQHLLKSNKTFDLVIVETFVNEAHLALAKHFNAHLVLITSNALSEWNALLISNPFIPSIMPTSFAGYTTSMTFHQRFYNTLGLLYDYYYKYIYRYPAHQALVNKYFPKKYNLNDLLYNASLILTCSHVSTSEPYLLTAGVVEVGGLHIKSKKLPEEFQQFLDSATNGVVLFSMGSNLKSSAMPKETVQSIFNFIRQSEQRFIWKFEQNDLENIPENLLISKWVPQMDILAHPNIVAFISHCGFGGTTEAVYHGVPVIAIPIYDDQFMNANRLVKFGMAVKLAYKQLSGETLRIALNEIVDDPRYKQNAEVRSRIMHDRPIKPLDLAVYSVEYVLRHNGAHHLKNSARELTWYQLYLIDVFGTIIILPYLLYIILRQIGRNVR